MFSRAIYNKIVIKGSGDKRSKYYVDQRPRKFEAFG